MKYWSRLVESICAIFFLLQVALIQEVLSSGSSILYLSMANFIAACFWWFVLRNDRDFSPGVLISGGLIVFALCRYLHDIGAQLPTKRQGEFLPASMTMAVGLAALSFSFAGLFKLILQRLRPKVDP